MSLFPKKVEYPFNAVVHCFSWVFFMQPLYRTIRCITIRHHK